MSLILRYTLAVTWQAKNVAEPLMTTASDVRHKVIRPGPHRRLLVR
jgi:hypothetical protein